MLTSRDWAIKQLAKHHGVLSVTPNNDVFINIERRMYEPFSSAILNRNKIDEDSIDSVLSLGVDVQFVTNLPKSGIWTGPAIEVIDQHSLGWGGLGDLMSVINAEDVRGFQKKEYAFVERALRQHSKVQRYDRIFDRVFRVFRWGLPNIDVALIYEYELTAEHLRVAVEKYGEFSVVVKTNPNGKITMNASEVGEQLGVEVLSWGEFYQRLNWS